MKCIVAIIVVFIFMKMYTRELMAASMTLQSSQTDLSIDQELLVQVSLSIQSADSTNYYLRGMFYKEGVSGYCGYTWNGSDWYRGPYSSGEGWKKLQKITVASESWNGELKVKIDPEDSACQNSGTYKLKVQRYNENSGSSTVDQQNEITINVIVPTQTPTPLPTSKPTPTLKPTPTSKPTATTKPAVISKVPSAQQILNESIKSTPVDGIESSSEVEEGVVLGEDMKNEDINSMLQIATASSNVESILKVSVTESKNQKGMQGVKKSLTFGFGGVLLLFSSCGILVMRKLQNSREE